MLVLRQKNYWLGNLSIILFIFVLITLLMELKNTVIDV